MSELVPYTTFLSKRKAKREEQTREKREEIRTLATQGFIMSLVETVVDNEDQTLSTYGGVVALGSTGYGTQYYIQLGIDKKFKEKDRVFFKVKYDGHRHIATDLLLLH
jgi:hypothetical protein